MVSAAVFAAVLYHPSSPFSGAISNELVRRALMGLAMGSTAAAIIYSPWGQRSGAHMNPAVTLTFFRLGKVARPDFVGYITAQFIGAIVGIAAAAVALGGLVSDPSVNYVTTLPGPTGDAVAFVAEAAHLVRADADDPDGLESSARWRRSPESAPACWSGPTLRSKRLCPG